MPHHFLVHVTPLPHASNTTVNVFNFFPPYYLQFFEHIYYYSKRVQLSGKVRLSGKEVKLSGKEVRLSGKEVKLSGKEVKLSGKEVRLSGKEVRLSGKEVRLSGKD